MNLLYKLKTGWTALKFIRVGLGGLILYSAVDSGHVPGIVLGAFFILLSLFTDGVCCAGGYCATPVNKKRSSIAENTDYEELGAK